MCRLCWVVVRLHMVDHIGWVVDRKERMVVRHTAERVVDRLVVGRTVCLAVDFHEFAEQAGRTLAVVAEQAVHTAVMLPEEAVHTGVVRLEETVHIVVVLPEEAAHTAAVAG